MKKIMLFIIAACMLLIPAAPIMGKESNQCRIFEKVFNTSVEQENDVCKMEIVRKNIHVSNLGVALSPEAVELSFGANFERVGKQTAVIGEFALLGSEVNPVIDTLRKGNIEISALHNHLIGEQPRILYLHFQALGDAETLARTVKEAIDKTSSK
ncbi:DUF1259 domain-containing protein [Paenibacillus sp. KQZ6P-2]|uniref:DUF1259 domain-containing protein n=1 Tax=Paenibacillus mangrovi TaxID=2931978 RepID=A0A9X2B7K2_9BACL|nr:DUF1259 domain-containing protein [Paenibacillus mangrovi]MCJ8013743.1 DUF1259 domain-containing protein [Paenibacillus mangrovi]